MTTDIAVRESLMPALTIQEAVARYNATVEFVRQVMKPDLDFGKIPGTDKPTLLKPGAEKLCTLFGLVPEFETVQSIVDFDRGLFYFHYRCRLTRQGATVATGEGSCNSKEKKYRYRTAERVCPNCGKPVRKSKTNPEWYCWAKQGGCGATFPLNDPKITSQEAGQVENTEPFDLINTLQKMGQKRALVAAVLIAANASEFFTQDVEDLEYVEGEVVRDEPAKPAAPRPAAPPQPEPPKVNGGVQKDASPTVDKAAKVKTAIVQTAEWQKGATALANRCPHYLNKLGNGPNYFHMLAAAAKLGFESVNDLNLGQVLNALEDYAAKREAEEEAKAA